MGWDVSVCVSEQGRGKLGSAKSSKWAAATCPARGHPSPAPQERSSQKNLKTPLVPGM